MSWGARVKAAIRGEVDGADVRALLAASASLASLQRALADRRLDAELVHLQEAWRVAIDLGDLAAPLWLADTLITLAGSLVDAEAPSMMSALAHRQALALLQPVAPIITELSAMLADPQRLSTLPLPVSIVAQSSAIDQMVPFLPPSYVRGMLRGADRLEGAAQLALEDLATLAGRSPAPAWLTAGIQRLRGELAAAQAQLAMIHTRSASLLNQPSPDNNALRQLDADLWPVLNAYLHAGQLATAPRLLPGAPPLAALGRPQPPQQPVPAPRVTSAANPPSASPQPTPAPPLPPVERDPVLPEIAPDWQRPAGAARPAPPATPIPEQRARPLPQIGNARPADASPAPRPGIPYGDAALPAQPPAGARPRELPRIESSAASGGAAAERGIPHIDAAPPAQTAAGARPRELPRIESPAASGSTEASAAPRTGVPIPGVAPLPDPSASARHIERAERWLLASSGARHRLRAAGLEERAERDLAAFWQAKDWALSARDQAYLGQVVALTGSMAIAPSGRSLDEPPFAPIFRVLAPQIVLLNLRLSAGSLFAFDYRKGLVLYPGPQDGTPES